MMASCKNCLHIDICDKLRPIEYCMDKTCSRFQNKADVVEVVRCKDCKHARRTVYCYYGCKVDGSIAHNETDFCSYGERKEE